MKISKKQKVMFIDDYVKFRNEQKQFKDIEKDIENMPYIHIEPINETSKTTNS